MPTLELIIGWPFRRLPFSISLTQTNFKTPDGEFDTFRGAVGDGEGAYRFSYISMTTAKRCVAYLGPPASFTHQATLTAFPITFGVAYKPHSTIPAVFDAVRSGSVDHGVVPFYNSTHGAVIATLDCFASELRKPPTAASSTNGATCNADDSTPAPRTTITHEIVLPIRHCLLGFPPSSTNADTLLPATIRNGEATLPSLTHLQTICSHEQALGQCTTFLATHAPQAEQISFPSTSKAAEMVAAAHRSSVSKSSVAAISSALAAVEYDVPILAENIQDRDDNCTRFFVLSLAETTTHNTTPPCPDAAPSPKPTKSLLAFTVPHHHPGALVRVLSTLFQHKLNMTGIHQRPPDAAEGREDDIIFVEVEANGSLDEEEKGKVFGDVVEEIVRQIEGQGVTGGVVGFGCWG